MSKNNWRSLSLSRKAAALALVCTVIINATARANQSVEVRLVSLLDETRGFCIDILGPKSRAKVENGLQAHTCYSYQGEIGIDQAFDKALTLEDTFYLPEFNVCMTASTVSSGASIILQACKKQASQQFSLQADATIRPTSDASLCLTVSDKDSIQGGGGTPPHLKRPLSLQACDKSMAEFQRWSLHLP